MNTQNNREILSAAHDKGPVSTFFAFFRLSGPGWLQSAITLGGGSLTGALYLGMLGGTNLLWLQLVAIVIGVIMLSAISYVTLTTGKRPYAAINEYVNPVLGVGWIVATILANMIWIMPQFSLCFDSLDKSLGVVDDTQWNKQVVSGVIALVALGIVAMSFRPGWASKIFDWVLKIMVGVVVLCFVGVVVLLFQNGSVNWQEILNGFVPRFSQWNSVSPELVKVMGDLTPAAQEYWTSKIVESQRKSMITVTATAVGLNMTFLLPYSMLARGWDRPFRGLARFDLITALAIPYLLVTSCIVIASANAFHAKADAEFLSDDAEEVKLSKLFNKDSQKILAARWKETKYEEAIAGLRAKQLGERIDILQPFEARLLEEYGVENEPEGDDPKNKSTVRTVEMTDEQRMEVLEGYYGEDAKSKAVEDFSALSDDDRTQKLAEFAAGLTTEERRVMATLIKPNVRQLAAALEPLLGPKSTNGKKDLVKEKNESAEDVKNESASVDKSSADVQGKGIDRANLVFGLGAFAMGFSTIIILMLINGYAVAEIAGRYQSAIWRVLGAFAAAAVGFAWWWIWADESKTWLGIVASTFAAILLPVAYVSFFALMNNKALLGDAKPRGLRMLIWNILMIIGVIGAFAQAILAGIEKTTAPGTGPYVIGGLVTFGVLVLVGFSAKFRRGGRDNGDPSEGGGGMDSSG